MSDFSTYDPTEYERATCIHCKKRRKVARWYMAYCGPCFPTCSECKDIPPVRGRDYEFIDPGETDPELARVILNFFNPGLGELLGVK
jgi:hypothetical protein